MESSPLAPSKLTEVFLSGPSTPGWPRTKRPAKEPAVADVSSLEVAPESSPIRQ